MFYVGKGKNKRAWQLKENLFFLKMYNSHVCDVRIVLDHLSESDAFNKEIELIKFYREKTDFRLTNIADGGNQPPTLKGEDSPTKRPEVRAKISQSLKAAYTDINLRNKISKKQKLYLESDEGKKEKSERSKKIMSNLQIREKIKSSNNETWSNVELRNKQSAIMKSCYNNQNALEARRKAVVQLDIESNYINTYNSLVSAEKATGVGFRKISAVLRKINKTAGGYIWVYYDDYIFQNDINMTIPSQAS